MKPKWLLRSAAIIMLLHDMGHTVGALTWKQSDDQVQQKVIQEMTQHQFPFMGAVRSLGEYYEGYGVLMILAMLLISAMLWIVSDTKPQYLGLSIPLLVVSAAVLLLWGIIELVYFFPFAAAFSLLACSLTTIAAWQLRRTGS